MYCRASTTHSDAIASTKAIPIRFLVLTFSFRRAGIGRIIRTISDEMLSTPPTEKAIVPSRHLASVIVGSHSAATGRHWMAIKSTYTPSVMSVRMIMTLVAVENHRAPFPVSNTLRYRSSMATFPVHWITTYRIFET